MKKEHTELRRRPLLTPVWLTALAGLAAIAVIAWFLTAISTTTVVVVRHAEKELGTIEDPPLSPAGEQRAQLLARMFGEPVSRGRIAAVFASDTRRSQRTAAPLAARLRLPVTTVPATDIDGLIRRIHDQYRGRNVLVVGHGNTVPEIVRRLSRSTDVPEIPESDYGQIYIVTVPTLGPAAVLKLNY